MINFDLATPLPQGLAEKLAEAGYDVPRAGRIPTPYDGWVNRIDEAWDDLTESQPPIWYLFP